MMKSKSQYAEDWADELIHFYESYGIRHFRYYAATKVLVIFAAAAIPVFVVIKHPSLDVLIAALGALIVVLEGLQATFKYQEKWITSIATREAIENELRLFQSGAGPYMPHGTKPTPDIRLAERISAISRAESQAWVRLQQENNTQSNESDDTN